MGRIQSILRPETIAEAVQLLRQGNGRAAVLAGGTSLAVRSPANVDTLVDISALGLHGVAGFDGGLSIKARTPLAHVAASAAAQQFLDGVIPTACNRVASTPLRNMITFGGNLFQPLPWSDLPALMLALNADFVVTQEQTRTISADTLYAPGARSIVKPGDILTEVRIPAPPPDSRAVFHKVSRTGFDYATLDVAVAATMAGSTIAACRVVLGCVRTLPIRVAAAEEELIGKSPSPQLFASAAAKAAGSIEPAHDFRFSQEYRRHLIKVWVRRALHETFGTSEAIR